jgi:CRISPR-associated protein Csb2
MVWRSLTPYVPPRRHLRGGKVRKTETIENQVRREFMARGYAPSAELLSVEEIKSETARSRWVTVHMPRREVERRSIIVDRRSYMLYLSFATPVSGPLILGHSSRFGLGLFAPDPRCLTFL